jgi:SAM-dependent methyltransferase
MASSEAGLPVPPRLRRSAHGSQEAWLESAMFAVDLLCRTIGRDDLSEVDLLDVGCGTKIVKVLLDNSLPIGHYTGIDVAPEVIDWLQTNVLDPRFEFHRLDAHNALYNPEGEPLSGFDLLPVEPRRFDLICLFSVFTHLAPRDYVAMLRLLRRHIKPGGTLLFSLFLDDPEHPSYHEQFLRDQLKSDDPEVRAEAEVAVEETRRRISAARRDSGFVDEIPDRPLLIARYTRGYAIELFEDTDWEIEAIHPPEPRGFIQHHMVCRPI